MSLVQPQLINHMWGGEKGIPALFFDNLPSKIYYAKNKQKQCSPKRTMVSAKATC